MKDQIFNQAFTCKISQAFNLVTTLSTDYNYRSNRSHNEFLPLFFNF